MAQSFLRCLCGSMAMYIEWLFDLARILKCEKVYGEWKRINGYTRKFKKVGSHLLFDWRYQTEPHQTWWKFTSDSNYPTRNSRPENDCSRKPIQTLIEKSDNFLSKHIHQVIKTDKVSVSISHGNHFEEIDKYFQVLSLAPEKKKPRATYHSPKSNILITHLLGPYQIFFWSEDWLLFAKQIRSNHKNKY